MIRRALSASCSHRALTVAASLWLAGPALAQTPPGGGGPMSPTPPYISPTVTVAPRQPITMAIFGDSIAANADSTNAAVTCTTQCSTNLYGSYLAWAELYSNYTVMKVPNTLNFGISGQTTTQYLTRMGPVLSSGANVIMIEGGANDIGASASCATITANFTSMYQQFQANGQSVIKVGIYPRLAPAAFTTAQANIAMCVNQFDRYWAQTAGNSGFYFVDLDPSVVDASQATWTIKAGLLKSDGIHPSMSGGSVMGYAIAQVLSKMAPQWLFPIYSRGDAYDATNNPRGNLISSGAGMFTGTSGSATTGCTTSSGVATNWSLYLVNSPGATCAGTLTTLADGRTCQVITISGNYSGNGTGINLQNFSAGPGNVNAGDVLEAQAWVNIGTNSSVIDVDYYMKDTESAVDYYNHAAGLGGDTVDAFPAAGWATGTFVPLLTSRRTTTITPSGLGVVLNIILANAAGSTAVAATVTICSASIKKVQ